MSIFDMFRNKSVTSLSLAHLSPTQIYERLDEYYNNNSLYDGTTYSAAYNNVWMESMKGLRTVVHRSVEFYASHIAKDITVTAVQDTVQESIKQVHKWSNLEAAKRLAIRQFALYGDSFAKVVSTDTKVYFEFISPKLVTDFEEDKRGNLTYIRLDSQIEVNEQMMTYTEIWDKGDMETPGYMGNWIHNMGIGADIEQIGSPQEYYPMSEFGIDFIPFVHVKFTDTGKKRGSSAVAHALLKIDDANRNATRLEQLLFRHNKPFWAVRSNANDANGRPLPAPRITGTVSNSASDDMEIKDGTMIYLPGNASMESLIPNINYADALAILKDAMNEIEQDLPELKYFSINDTNLSGKAIRSLLAGAIDRGAEAQANFLSAIEKLDEMSLTIGIYAGIFPASLGTYEAGSFEHTVSGGELFAIDAQEKATILAQFVQAGMPLASAMKYAGFAQEEIDEAVSLKTEQDASQQANFLTRFNAV